MCVGLAPLCLFMLSLVCANNLSRLFLPKKILLLVWAGLWIPCCVYAVQIGFKYHMMLLAGGGIWIVGLVALSAFLSQKNISPQVRYTAKMSVLVLFVVALTIIFIHTDFLATLPQLKPFHHYAKSFDISMTHTLSPHKTCSEYSLIKCDWRYFPGTLLVKTPVMTLILSFIGFFLLIFSPRKVIQKAVVVIPPIFYFAFASMVNQINIGVRHILPVYPFLFLMAGATIYQIGCLSLVKVRKFLYAILFIFIFALAYRNLSYFPYFIPYFNELIGGPEKGVNYLTDSNLIWGQDGRRLIMFTKNNQIPLIKIASSAINPDEFDYYQARWLSMSNEDFVRPGPGWYALDLLAYNNEQFNSSSWFYRKKPDYKAGSTFYIFHIQ